MAVEIVEASGRRELLEFVNFPYRLYKKEKNWIPPLIREQKDWIVGGNTALFKKNPHVFLLAKKGIKVVGRVAVVEDLKLKEEKKRNKACFTLLECIDDFQVFQGMMKRAENWARSRGLEAMQGPVSPTKGDDFRGLLVWGYDSKPVIMNSYHFPYYQEFFERAGYEKYLDLYAYYYDLRRMGLHERISQIEGAMRRFGFRVDRFDLKNIESEVRDIKQVLDVGIPQEWPDLVPPAYGEILAMARRFKKFADPDFILIARDRHSHPVGFTIGLPDYNFVLDKVKGRLDIRGILKFLYYRRKIKGGRIFVIFVIPEFRRKGVSTAIYFTAMKHALKKGYVYAEGSTIGEGNIPMRTDAEKGGGKHYKTYRIYEKQIGVALQPL